MPDEEERKVKILVFVAFIVSLLALAISLRTLRRDCGYTVREVPNSTTFVLDGALTGTCDGTPNDKSLKAGGKVDISNPYVWKILRLERGATRDAR